MTYAVLTVFGIVYGLFGPAPYSMEECPKHLSSFELPAELEAEVYCVAAADAPPVGEFSIEQQDKINAWIRKQKASK